MPRARRYRTGKGSHHSRRIGVASRRRYQQLAAGGILAGHRPALHAGSTRSTCSTSPTRIRAGRWGSVERCALTWASSADTSRPSSPQPGKSPGDDRSRITAALERGRGLATAGGLLFGGDGSGNFVAFDAKVGKPLWHTGIGTISNAPQTYMLDGQQYVLVATGTTLWAFTLN